MMDFDVPGWNIELRTTLMGCLSGCDRIGTKIETYEVLIPVFLASLNISTAHSVVISGSLYVLVITDAPCCIAKSTIFSAEIS